jgi:hypothetical protein
LSKNKQKAQQPQNNSQRGAPKKRSKMGATNMERFLGRIFKQHPLIAQRKFNRIVGHAGKNYSGAKS